MSVGMDRLRDPDDETLSTAKDVADGAAATAGALTAAAGVVAASSALPLLAAVLQGAGLGLAAVQFVRAVRPAGGDGAGGVWAAYHATGGRGPAEELVRAAGDVLSLGVWWAVVKALEHHRLEPRLVEEEIGAIGDASGPPPDIDAWIRAPHPADAAWRDTACRALLGQYRLLLRALANEDLWETVAREFTPQFSALLARYPELSRYLDREREALAPSTVRRAFPRIRHVDPSPPEPPGRVDPEEYRHHPSWKSLGRGLYVPRSVQPDIRAKCAPDPDAATVVLLEGPAGAGKTVVLLALGAELARAGFPVHWADDPTVGPSALAELISQLAGPLVLLVDDLNTFEHLARGILRSNGNAGLVVLATLRSGVECDLRTADDVRLHRVDVPAPDPVEVAALAERVAGRPTATPGSPRTMLELLWALGGSTFADDMKAQRGSLRPPLGLAVDAVNAAALHGAPPPLSLVARMCARASRPLDLWMEDDGAECVLRGADAGPLQGLLRGVGGRGRPALLAPALDHMAEVLSQGRKGVGNPLLDLLAAVDAADPDHREFVRTLAAVALRDPNVPPATARAVLASSALLAALRATHPVEMLSRWWPVLRGISRDVPEVAGHLAAAAAPAELRTAIARWVEVADDAAPRAVAALLVEVLVQARRESPDHLSALVSILTSRPELTGGEAGGAAAAPVVAAAFEEHPEVGVYAHYLSQFTRPGHDLERATACRLALRGLRARADGTTPTARGGAAPYLLALRIVRESPDAPTPSIADALVDATLAQPATESLIVAEAHALARLDPAIRAQAVHRWIARGRTAAPGEDLRREAWARVERPGSGGVAAYIAPTARSKDVDERREEELREALASGLAERNAAAAREVLSGITKHRGLRLMRWGFRRWLAALDRREVSLAETRKPLVHLSFHRWSTADFYGTETAELERDVLDLLDRMGPPSQWGTSLNSRDRAFWARVLRRLGRTNEAWGLVNDQLRWIARTARQRRGDVAERDLLLERAKLERIRGDVPAAITTAKHVIELAGVAGGNSYQFAWMGLAMVRRGPGRKVDDATAREVVRALEQARDLDANQAGPHNQLMRHHLLQGDMDAAADAAVRAQREVRDLDRQPAALAWLARVEAGSRDHDAAASRARQLLDITAGVGERGVLWREMEAYVDGDLTRSATFPA